MQFKSAACCFAFCALAIPASADTFILKDGSTLEGTILREQGESYVLEIQVTKSIKDERVVPKDEVVKIERAKPDLAAFKEIANLVPIPDLLTEQQYAERIRRVEKFLTLHRGSAKRNDAQAILANYKAEANEIIAGGIKLGGKIIAPAEYRANALDVDASIGKARINALLADRKFVQALRDFSQFDAEFQNTTARSELLPLIVQTINRYIAEVEQSLAGYDKRISEQISGLDRMRREDRRNTEIALKEQTTAFEERLAAEKQSKLGWVSTNPYFKPSLEETLNFGRQELKRLTSLSTAPQTDAGKAYRDALLKIQQDNNTTALITAALSEARAAKVPPKYLATLEAAAASATKDLAPK